MAISSWRPAACLGVLLAAGSAAGSPTTADGRTDARTDQAGLESADELIRDLLDRYEQRERATEEVPAPREHQADTTSSPRRPGAYEIYAWRGDARLSRAPGPKFPEDKLPELHGRAPYGFHCSGGGTRSYSNCVGAFRGLHLGNYSLPKYLFGISGGSWFTALYSYIPESVATDAELLSEQDYHQNLSSNFDSKFPTTALLAAPTRKLWWEVIYRLFQHFDIFSNAGAWRYIWQEALYYVFMQPYGLDSRTAAFTWRKNGGALPGVDYFFVRPNRGYPVVGTAFLELYERSQVFPQPWKDRKFLMNEISPLYVGFSYLRNVSYIDVGPVKNKTILIGGLLEPHGYGSEPPATGGLPEGTDEGYLRVTTGPAVPFTLQRAIAHSSFAPGALVATTVPAFDKAVIDFMDYWSVSDEVDLRLSISWTIGRCRTR